MLYEQRVGKDQARRSKAAKEIQEGGELKVGNGSCKRVGKTGQRGGTKTQSMESNALAKARKCGSTDRRGPKEHVEGRGRGRREAMAGGG